MTHGGRTSNLPRFVGEEIQILAFRTVADQHSEQRASNAEKERRNANRF